MTPGSTVCVVETEPDDGPEEASSTVGTTCLTGTLPAGDQDLFLWESPAAGSRGSWTITLEGVTGARTVLDLRPVTSEPGHAPLVMGGPLLAMSAEAGTTEPVRREDVLLAPGRYLVGLSASGPVGAADEGPLSLGGPALGADVEADAAGGGAEEPGAGPGYVVTLSPGAPLPPLGDMEPNDVATSATAVSGEFALSGDLIGSMDMFRWTVPSDASGAWTLASTTQLGSGSSLRLSSADGATVLAQAQPVDGRIELPDLVLDPGEYVITVGVATSVATPYVLLARSAPGPMGDPEPNDTPGQAVPMEGDTPLVRGRFGRSQDDDWYRFDIDEVLAAGTVDVRMLWHSGLRRELCLHGPDATVLLCRDSTSGLNVSGLSLAAGRYTLRVRGEGAPEEVYLIRVDPAGSIAADFEREPDDSFETATPVVAGTALRARALGPDVDYFRLSVSGDPQLWRVEAQGRGLRSLEWVRPGGERLGTADVADDASLATLTDLYLTAGEHWLRVTAEDGEYTFSTTSLGPPDPNAEREPNDLAAREERLVVGRERVGRLPTSSDRDAYRFTLRGTDHVLLSVTPPEDGRIDVQIRDDVGLSRRFQATAAEPVRDDLLLGPGDYRVVLSPVVPSQERYHIDLQRLDPFESRTDQEPNDSASDARPWPSSGIIEGTASGDQDLDWFALPPSTDGAPLRVQADGEVTALTLRSGDQEQPLRVRDDGLTYESGPLSPGLPLLLRVAAVGPYTLSRSGGMAAPSSAAPQPGLDAELALADAAVAAWWPRGQRLDATVRLANRTGMDLEVELQALASDRSWRLTVPGGSWPVPAGGSSTVPLDVLIPADVPGDEPVRLAVLALTADGMRATANVDVEPSREVLPREQVVVWPVPAELLGGLDVASLALGATPVPSLDAEGEARLHDGVVAIDWGLAYPIAGLPVTLTVDLAGNEPVPVAGTIIEPFAEDPTLANAPRDFELALSTDGVEWEMVLGGTLERVSGEQAFALPQPVEAKYAQLRIVSGQHLQPTRLTLGEWKVVATPGWSPPGEPVDLADRLAGGHVVWMSPQPDTAEQAASMLDDATLTGPLVVEKGAGIEWVLGFMDDRAARVSSIEWRDPQPSDAGTRLRRVEVAVSETSPLGPWRSLGEWDLQRAADGSVVPFVPEEPVWARFLRFSATTGSKQTAVELPDRLRVRETAQDPTYRSILGQWGMGSPAGPLEWSTSPAELELDDEGSPSDDRAHARDLREGEPASGRVHFGSDTDWYRFTVPDGRRSLTLTVSGRLSAGAGLALWTPEGVELPMAFGPGDEPGSVAYEANVEPGARYLVEVSQPRSSIVVSFDSSASVANQLAAIEAGLRTLAEGMTGDREALRVVPFDNRPLLPDWSSDPWHIADAVNRFELRESSSAAESNLRQAALDLATREGGRAILLITDAASSSYRDSAKAWSALAVARPAVFTVAIGGQNEAPAIERHHLMADWAASSGGVSSQARGAEEVLGAFDRLATWLRRPVTYQLELQTFAEALPPPEPGRIGVVAPVVGGRRPAVLGPDTAVELIVDTSGSMRKRLGGMSRIAVAKQVLGELVREDIPAGVPVALRVFQPSRDRCDTQLLSPLGPLDPAAMVATIDGLTAPRKAPTPLARAIAAVANDLSEVTGPRIVVVVSDGKESCKGDPSAEVRRLRSQGFDVTLHAVGLALDKPSRKAISRLADLGGGSYFDTRDPETLGAALRAAVSAPFEVRDGDEHTVVRGTVGGDPVEVPPGRYRVVVLTDPPAVFSDVSVSPDADITLSLPEPEGAVPRDEADETAG